MTSGSVHMQPQSWWGWHGWHNQPEPMSITRLIQAGNLSPRVAALLWMGLERGASIIVAADPPRVGKTATLTALLAFVPEDARAHYTSGWGETFDVPPLSPDRPTYLLVNEISDHLPVYLWGPPVARAFELVRQGYSVGATMHADTVEDVIRQLTGDNGVPPDHLRRLTFIVPLRVLYRDGTVLRRVSEVAFSTSGSADGPGPRYDRVVRWDEGADTFHVLEEPSQVRRLAGWTGMDTDGLLGELARREEYLRAMLDANVMAGPDVRERIRAYRAGG